VSGFSESLPLALYVHIPWCLQKCPYCDFNSHALAGDPDESAYVTALLQDLERDRSLVAGRRLGSIFIGGGTPSLFSGKAIRRLMDGIRARVACAPEMEVTLEANPGAVDQGHFAAYRAAGVNRLSIGVQSFDREMLQRLGRIHGPEEAVAAVAAARRAGFDNLNLDLMYGLPGQGQDAAGQDLEAAISLQPEHLSYYQLTIEPNTLFHAAPPVLPEDERLWEIEAAGHERLRASGYRQYEVSAFARSGRQCRHNRNYWEFGDYLGIGAGAHGKVTDVAGQVRRYRKPRAPERYLEYVDNSTSPSLEPALGEADLVLEFMLNALRLTQGFPPPLFQRRTGLSLGLIRPQLERAVAMGLLQRDETLLRPSPVGRRFLNELVALFMLPD
jgi:putative oxygen-independent coproporphyrinogen III oxidase